MRIRRLLPVKVSMVTAVITVLAVMGGLVISVLWHGSNAVFNQMNMQYMVAIDPGHGGYDPGAITPQGVYEKELTLQVSQRISKYLKPSGINVLLTRDKDEDYVPKGTSGKSNRKRLDLNHRIDLALEANADIFVSLHVNSVSKGQNSGAETFYHHSSEEGKRLAEAIQGELIKIHGMNRRIAKASDFYIVKHTKAPAVIVEMGYLSNHAERNKLQQEWYQEQLAKAIAKGIAQYFGLP